YTTWRPGFYPAGTSPKEFLRYYGERLPSVELFGTFYRLPSESQLEARAEQTPPGFRFAVKMSPQITHFVRLDLVRTVWPPARPLPRPVPRAPPRARRPARPPARLARPGPPLRVRVRPSHLGGRRRLAAPARRRARGRGAVPLPPPAGAAVRRRGAARLGGAA